MEKGIGATILGAKTIKNGPELSKNVENGDFWIFMKPMCGVGMKNGFCKSCNRPKNRRYTGLGETRVFRKIFLVCATRRPPTSTPNCGEEQRKSTANAPCDVSDASGHLGDHAAQYLLW